MAGTDMCWLCWLSSFCKLHSGTLVGSFQNLHLGQNCNSTLAQVEAHGT